MSDTAQISLQRLTENGANDGQPIFGQFNPASMQYAITNTARPGGGNQRSREVQDSVGKLTFDLVFDTSDTGVDVRLSTQLVAQLMQPATHRKTPVVKVSWGAFVFTGALDQYRETLDFFAVEGVPLRATLSLGFTTVTVNNATPAIVFTFAGLTNVTAAARSQQPGGTADTVEVLVGGTGPLGGGDSGGRSASQVASALGGAGLARSIGTANGLEDIRSPVSGTATLEVSADVVLDGPIAFSAAGGASFGAAAGFGASASAGFGASASAGFGASASAGFGASASAGFGASASAGFGASASAGFGASAQVSAGGSLSAGVSASAGAFARLGPRPAPPRQTLDLSKALSAPPAAPLVLNGNVEVGGRASLNAQAGFVADVGQQSSLRARVQFEED